MRVAVYYPWIYLKSGIERSIVEIKNRSRNDIRIFTNHYDRDATYPELKTMDVVELAKVPVERTYAAVGSAALTILRNRIDLTQTDVLLVCCDGLGSLLTFRHKARPIVNLCFTPLRAAYDLHYRERLLAGGGAKRLLKQVTEASFRAVDRLAWRNFDDVICIAETVRDRVAAGNLYPKDRLEIAYPGIADSHINPSDAFEPFFLLPGRIMWTKNIEVAIDAFKLFRDQCPPELKHFRLLIAGMVDAKSKQYYQKLVALAEGVEQISFMTEVSDAQMDDLYKRCWCVLAPAFNEDFGLTPLEAMARGKPVIASKRGGFRETVVDSVTGFLVEPEPSYFAEALSRMASSLPLTRQLGAAGPERARHFTWDRFVNIIDQRLEMVSGAR